MAAGIILAAGESSRMGSDKALLRLGRQSFLARLCAIFGAQLDPVVAVLGHNAEAIAREAGLPPEVLVVHNERYSDGMLSSLQTGLRAIPAGASVLFTLVDVPAVRSKTVRLLAEALERGGAPIVIPRCEGKRGHPVGVAPAVIAELLALDPTDSPQTVMRADRSRVLYLDVDDPFVLRDADEPEDYQRLLSDVEAAPKK